MGQNWNEEVWNNIERKLYMVANGNRGTIPYLTKHGVYMDMAKEDIFWWTNGFWGGIMWQMYHATHDEIYRIVAEETEEMMEKNLHYYKGMDHDSGFKWLLTAIANYRETGKERSKDRGLIAANSLMGRFNLAGNFIRAWNDENGVNRSGWAIIDCMMNLPLLYWAGEELNDPRFFHVAKAHADMVIKEFVREDGSVHHIVVFDPQSGSVIKTLGGQGYKEGSAWTRGQSWALYGFVLSYMHTKEVRYLHTAKKVADYFISKIPSSGLIPVDFMQPEECKWQDGTAAAIASCGLLELEKYVSEDEKNYYHEAAQKMLQALAEHASWDNMTDYIVSKCSVEFHARTHDFPMMYADYFFIEAILKLNGKELFMW